MGKSQRRAGANVKKADIRKVEGFCSITSLLVIVLCFLFASGLLQNSWMLNFIQMFGALMNLSLLLISFLRKKAVLGVLCFLLLIIQAASVVYFIL